MAKKVVATLKKEGGVSMTKVIKIVKSDKGNYTESDPKNGIAIIISQSPNMRRCDVIMATVNCHYHQDGQVGQGKLHF